MRFTKLIHLFGLFRVFISHVAGEVSNEDEYPKSLVFLRGMKMPPDPLSQGGQLQSIDYSSESPGIGNVTHHGDATRSETPRFLRRKEVPKKKKESKKNIFKKKKDSKKKAPKKNIFKMKKDSKKDNSSKTSSAEQSKTTTSTKTTTATTRTVLNPTEWTFLPGNVKLADSGLYQAGSDFFYHATYETKVNPGGIVSLDSIEEFVESVECSQITGIVHIKLKDNFDTMDPEDMYVPGAILVINREKFGPCDQNPPIQALENNELELVNETEFDIVGTNSQTDDSFFLINNVTGTLSNAVIEGIPTDYFAMFTEGSIEIDKVPAENTRELFKVIADGDALRIEATALSFAFLDIVVGVSLTNFGEIESFHALWSEDSELLIELKGAFQLQVKAEVMPTLKVEKKVHYDSKELLSIPIKGIKIPMKAQEYLGTIAEKLKVKLPEMKLGLFVELKLVWDVIAELQENLGASVAFEYTTGRYEASTTIRGNKWIPSVESNLIKVADPSFTMNFDPPEGLDSIPDVLNVEAFIGLRPQLIAYFTSVLTARISIDSGSTLATRVALDDNGFGPVTSIDDDPNGIVLGEACSDCHALELQVARTTRNAGFFVTLNWKFQLDKFKKKEWTDENSKYWWEPKMAFTLFQLTLPGNPSLSLVFLTWCLFALVEQDLSNGCTDTLTIGGDDDTFTCLDWCKLLDDCYIDNDCYNKGMGILAMACFENCLYYPPILTSQPEGCASHDCGFA